MNDGDKVKLALPEHLRPTANINQPITEALANGWTIQQIIDRLQTKEQPSHVVMALRDLATQQKPGGHNDKPKLIGTLGPCQNGCNYGWHNTNTGAAPCKSCRPDTYRRWRNVTAAKKNGATLDHTAALWHAKGTPTATTYPTHNY